MHVVVKRFMAACLVGYNVICQYTDLLTKNASELMDRILKTKWM